MLHLRANDPEGPNEWWLRNIARIQRENPNYCTEKYAVFRTHPCRENEDEEILHVHHPTRGYMVQDVCKRCRQRGGGGGAGAGGRAANVRRKRMESSDESSDDDDSDSDSDDDEAMFEGRRRRPLAQGEQVVMPHLAMVPAEDPQARMRAARIAAVERRTAAAAAPPVPAPAPFVAPAHPPVGVDARELIRRARLERFQAAEHQALTDARRRSLRRSLDERRARARDQISGRGQSQERHRNSRYDKKSRFGGMMIFSNQSKVASSKKKSVKKKKNSKKYTRR